jgi:hypothetical protein
MKGTALKFEVPHPVWTALRQEALNRRVTVKYLGARPSNRLDGGTQR